MSREFKLSKAELVLRKKSATQLAKSTDAINYGPNAHLAHRECDECVRKDVYGSKRLRNFSAGIQATLNMARAVLRISNLNF